MARELANADAALFLAINGLVGKHPAFDVAIRWLVSDYLAPVALALALVVMWFGEAEREARLRRQLGVFTALAAMGLAGGAVYLMNLWYFRPRPFDSLEDVDMLFYMPTDSSFPSNAAAGAFGIAFGILTANRKLGAAATALAFVCGAARVIAGVHYPLDVLGGAAIALAAAFLATRLRDMLMPALMAAIRLARALKLA